jgi:hypothetical protein
MEFELISVTLMVEMERRSLEKGSIDQACLQNPSCKVRIETKVGPMRI